MTRDDIEIARMNRNIAELESDLPYADAQQAAIIHQLIGVFKNLRQMLLDYGIRTTDEALRRAKREVDGQ